MVASLHEFCQYIDTLLMVEQFKDYCPNGLQVEACTTVQRVVTGVTASQALIDYAIKQKADALLVHHGYFWQGEQPSLTGIKAQRLAKLFTHHISLVAYHLPLDAHKELGNNAQLAKLLAFSIDDGLDDSIHPVGFVGKPNQAQNLQQLAQHIQHTLHRTPLVIGDQHKTIHKVAWCTGAAQSYIHKAIQKGADCFITGEVSEQTYHIANETGIAFIAAGHHATERYGVKALGEHVAKQFALNVDFIDIDNPV